MSCINSGNAGRSREEISIVGRREVEERESETEERRRKEEREHEKQMLQMLLQQQLPVYPTYTNTYPNSTYTM